MVSVTQIVFGLDKEFICIESVSHLSEGFGSVC
jgi:hypothetical protein